MFLGVDIGSSSSKAALIDKNGGLIGSQVINQGTGTDAARDIAAILLAAAGVKRQEILYSVVTGYGRMIYRDADAQVTEISCHGLGVARTLPAVRTIIDIGGQDAKVIRLDGEGRVVNFGMNEKCAAGTGRFLEVMARVLGREITALSALAAQSTRPVQISSVCTVFAESEVISQLAAGAAPADVARGAHLSVAARVAGMCGRTGVAPQVAMTGGVALNRDLVDAMAIELGVGIQVPPAPQIMGALGAAYYAQAKYARRPA
ncbi:MAG: acyl-CoA dehydratase activase [Peptococcaceae bacterium]|jgi:predicted CoA-substrate-specific enzyme activase|nr:acyl-CoA dehydratase activase [Peptococcaceae bacterium]